MALGGGPLEGDGCTGFLDGIGEWSWRQCCDAHDVAYGALMDRATADWDLATCVAGSGAPLAFLAAFVMWVALRIFGLPFYRGWIKPSVLAFLRPRR